MQSPRSATLAIAFAFALTACSPATEPSQSDQQPVRHPPAEPSPSASEDSNPIVIAESKPGGTALEIEFQWHMVDEREVKVGCRLRVLEGASANFMYSSVHVVDTEDNTYEPISLRAPERAIVESYYSRMIRTSGDEINDVELTYAMDEGSEFSHLVYDDFMNDVKYRIEMD
jgi:hypothetical protein